MKLSATFGTKKDKKYEKYKKRKMNPEEDVFLKLVL